MEIISLSTSNLAVAVAQAAAVVETDGIVIGPTDTVYGIFSTAVNEEAVKKLFALKQRPVDKALPIFVRDIAMARRHAYISDAKAKFLEKVWPGAVTVIFHHKEKLPAILTGGLDTIALRVPNHTFLLALLKRIDYPLAQTSANISNRPPAKNLAEIKTYFGTNSIQPNLVIDAGEIAGSSSTIIDFTKDTLRLVRMGWISKIELDRILKAAL